MNRVGEIIRKTRLEKGWSLEDLSNKSGVAKTTIWGVEKGSQPAYDKLSKIANALNIDVTKLIEPSMQDVVDYIDDKNKDNVTAHQIKNMMDGEYGVDGVALFFLFHDIVKEKFNCDFEKLSITEQDEILNSMYFAIQLKVNEILNRHKK